MKEFDTIAAIATAVGEGGVSIIRISGDKALKVISSVFQGKNGRNLEDIKPYTMRYGHIIEKNIESKDKELIEIVDEVLVSFMKGPKSFTAEDTIEINCHGGTVATNRVLKEVLKNGARLAEPGEFTKRAFLNGRIDLSQAEAVIDIINAKTELSMKSALLQSEGKISKEINSIRNKLLEIIAHIEATVDFPEEDLESMTAEKVSIDLNNIKLYIDTLIDSADEGKIIREGLNTVIVGKPNVGKSSLLNALLMENRAIVTDLPGTTRDVIEEFINIDGIPVKIIDTAGIRETEDIIEIIGVQKSLQKIESADLIILMLDLSRELDSEDKEIIQYMKNKKYIVLLNKNDLNSKINRNEIEKLNSDFIIETSTITGSGIDKLKKCITELFFRGEIKNKDMIITNARHKDALIKANESLKMALNALEFTLAIDLASIDIRNAWSNLGEISGETVKEDIIDKIFAEFCLGK